MWPADRNPMPDALARYWTALIRRAPADELSRLAEPFDPDLVATIDRMRVERSDPRPDPTFVARLEDDLMRTFAMQSNTTVSLRIPQPARPNGRFPSARSDPWLPARPLPALRRRVVQLALVVIVVAALGGSGFWYFSDDSPKSSIPAAVVTKSTPDPTSANDPEANKALVLRYLNEAWNQEKTDVVDEVLAPGFTWRVLPGEIYLSGRFAVKQEIEAVRASLEGPWLTIDVAIAEDEYVAIRWTLTSTSMATPATTTVLCAGTDFYRIEDGLIAELWQESSSCS